MLSGKSQRCESHGVRRPAGTMTVGAAMAIWGRNVVTPHSSYGTRHGPSGTPVPSSPPIHTGRARVSSTGFARSLRGSGTYAFAVLVQRGIGFLLLPLYTRVLSPDEYGQLALVLTISAGVSTLLSFGLETAVFRTYILLHDTPERRPSFVNSVGLLAMFGPAALAAVFVVALGEPFAELLDVSSLAIALGVATAAVTVTATVLPFAVLRAQERLRKYLELTAIQVVTNTTLTIAFVVVLGWGVAGWLLASLIAITVTLAAGLVMLGHRWTLTVERSYLITTLAFGLPLLPHAAAHWGLSLSDRLVLGAFASPGEVGLYQLAYQFAIPVSTLGIAMTRGTAPLYAHAARSAADRVELAGVIVHHVLIIALAGMATAMLGPPIIDLLMPPDFAGAGAYVPWLVLGTVLFALYFVPMNIIAILAGRTPLRMDRHRRRRGRQYRAQSRDRASIRRDGDRDQLRGRLRGPAGRRPALHARLAGAG